LINYALELGQTAKPEAVMFYILAPLAVAAAIGMLTVKKAVHSAILLAWVMVTLAIFYIAQGAAFLGVVQIVVYTGAVMMLFLFILMLVGVDSLGRATLGRPATGLADANSDGNVEGLAQLIFSDYVFPFEVISALLITAAVGAMVLAHHERTVKRVSQREQSQARFRSGSLAAAAGLPGPGVFALHNAVDVPALLPDGTPAPSSISATLKARGDMLDSAQYQLDKNDNAAEDK